MIYMIEELDFSNLTHEQVHHIAPELSLGDFSWDTPLRPLPFLEHDIRTFQDTVKGFYQRLTLLRCARNTRHTPTDAQIEAFTRYLVENQRDNPELHFGHGSWAFPEDTAMPGDAAVCIRTILFGHRLAGTRQRSISTDCKERGRLRQGNSPGNAFHLHQRP